MLIVQAKLEHVLFIHFFLFIQKSKHACFQILKMCL